jgi:hypothetical protein
MTRRFAGTRPLADGGDRNRERAATRAAKQGDSG